MSHGELLVNVILYLIGLVGLIVTWVLFRSALQAEPKKGELGGIYWAFVIVGGLSVLYCSRLPGVEWIPGKMMEITTKVVAEIVDEIRKDTASALAVQTKPTGSPADYVEWTSKTEIRPIVGKTLPLGWRVVYTLDQNQSWIVDKPLTVPETGMIWLAFDPDLSIHPSEQSFSMVDFTSSRPK